MDIVNRVLLFFGGLGVFLIAMSALGLNLEAVAGSKLRKMFDKISNKKLVGVGIGTAVTAVIQSSSATTVMVLGFVNAGIMTLMQATPIIMGANIGTTVTGFLVSLQSLKVTLFLAMLAGVGAFMMMSAKANIKKIGSILAYLGMLFIGLEIMGDAMGYFQTLAPVRNFLASINNPFLLLLIGIVFTALMQSSSAMTAVILGMLNTNLITLNSSIFIILGVNIGACVTVLLATFGTSTNAKRAAVIHLMFNVFGAVIFFLPQFFTSVFNAFGEENMGVWTKVLGFIPNRTFQLSTFHLFFNVVTMLLLLPATKYIVKISELLVKDKKSKSVEEEQFVENKLTYIDDRILETPAIAVSQLTKEILLMASIAKKNLDLAVTSILTKNIDKIEKFNSRERQINFMNKEISKYLVKMSTMDISYRDELKIASYYHVISDIERIGDYAENIMEYTSSMFEDSLTFSDVAIDEIKDMYAKVSLVYDNVIKAFENKDITVLPIIETHEDSVDECQKTLGDNHIERLTKNLCSPANGAIFISLVNNLERIADHMTNIAMSIKTYARPAVGKTSSVIKKNKTGELFKIINNTGNDNGKTNAN